MASISSSIPTRTRLTGGRLIAARAAWATYVAIALFLFVAALPAQWDKLVAISERVRAASPGGVLGDLTVAAAKCPGCVFSVEILVVLVLSLTAGVIMASKSDDPMTLYVSLAHVGYAVFLSPPLDAMAAAEPGLGRVANVVQAIGLISALLFLYLFPDGRFFPRWTRALSVAWVVVTLAWGFFPGLPFNSAEPFNVTVPWFLLFMGWWASGALAQLWRYRSTPPSRRGQTKWIVLAMIGGVVAYFVLYLTQLMAGQGAAGFASAYGNLVALPTLILLVLPIPVTVSIAILKHGLFDIEVFVNRALVYGTLSALLGLAYFGVVALLQELLRPFTGGSRIAIAGSTLMVAALFRPTRARIQDFIDRRFYRAKYDALRTLEAFAARLRDEVQLDVLTSDLVGVIEETVQPAHVSLWLQSPEAKEALRRYQPVEQPS